jgi:hypothetical protein
MDRILLSLNVKNVQAAYEASNKHFIIHEGKEDDKNAANELIPK